MQKPFVFFDLGQTLIDEWDFIQYFDGRLLEMLNGFGARIDRRNYIALRDNMIRDRMIGTGSVRELLEQIARHALPAGYDKAIFIRMQAELSSARKQFFRLAEGVSDVLAWLGQQGYEVGTIANQSSDITEILQAAGIDKIFKVKAISSEQNLSKPDLRIFNNAIRLAGRQAAECVMIGDRLDTDIAPANQLGMTTIRTTNSLFALQAPTSPIEVPKFTVSRLAEIPETLDKISRLRK